MFTKWKEIKKDINFEKKHVVAIYKLDGNWKIHLRDTDQELWMEFTFFMKERKVLGTYILCKNNEEGVMYNFESF